MKPPTNEHKMSLKRAIADGDSEVKECKKVRIDLTNKCFTLNSLSS